MDWFFWRPIIAGHITLTEAAEVATLDDFIDVHLIMDCQQIAAAQRRVFNAPKNPPKKRSR